MVDAFHAFDLWVLLIFTKVIPDFFQERADCQAQQAYYVNMQQALPQASGSATWIVSLQVTMVTSQTKYKESLDKQEMIDMMAEDDRTTDSSSCEDLEIQENSDSAPLLL